MSNTIENTESYLSRKYPLETLKKILAPRAQWKPFPTAGDRAGWEGLPEAVRQAHIRAGETALTRAWPHLEASNYLQYARNGNRDQYEKPYFARRDILGALVIAECVEGKGRFLDGVTNALWSICEESSWVLPAHIGAQQAGFGLPDTAEPVVDLFDGETAAHVAWTAYLLGDQLQTVSPLIMPRVLRELQLRILTPNLERDDFWWMGFGPRKVNNWNPWVNSNWLACALLMEQDEERRATAVYKILRSLDRFLVPYPKDGGCDEGPGYWSRAGASLYDNLELLLNGTAGQLDEFGNELVCEIGRYVYRAHIAGKFYLNFADASSVLTPEPTLIYTYGKRIADARMQGFGAWLAEEAGLIEKGIFPARITPRDIAPSLGRVLPGLFTLAELAQQPAAPPLVRDVFLPEIQVMVARDHDGSTQGLYVAAKGGHNDESHNHNDVGNFVTYIDGKPVLVDVGVETYTRKTFSAQRYEIWTMQSAYHSLPTINGVMQAPGEAFAAHDVQYAATEDSVRFSLDIAAAYPAQAQLKSWQRTLTLERGRQLLVADAYEMAAKPAELTLSLMTPCQVDDSQPGLLVLSPAPLVNGLTSGAGKVSYDPVVFSVRVEEISINDARLASTWGQRLCRLLFVAKDPQASGAWQIRVSA